MYVFLIFFSINILTNILPYFTVYNTVPNFKKGWIHIFQYVSTKLLFIPYKAIMTVTICMFHFYFRKSFFAVKKLYELSILYHHYLKDLCLK